LNRLSKKNETQLRGFCPRGGKIPSIGSYVFIITESCVPLVTDFSVVLFTDNNIIVHKRGTAQNSIIMEVKVYGKNGDREHDLIKLERYRKDLNYKHAVFVELFKNRENNVIHFIGN